MNHREYEKLKECEKEMWWFRTLHGYLIRMLSLLGPTHGDKLLDIGCGSGGWLKKMAKWRLDVSGIDLSPTAVGFCKESGLAKVYVANANRLPYRNAVFDIVTCIDVLESRAVVPQEAISELVRVLKCGGGALIVMAAHQMLLSEHDRAVHSVRRYNKQQLIRLLTRFPVKIVHTTYLFTSLFPIMCLWKLINMPKRQTSCAKAASDVKLPHPIINKALINMGQIEASLQPRFSMPLGTSVCAVIRKHDN